MFVCCSSFRALTVMSAILEEKLHLSRISFKSLVWFIVTTLVILCLLIFDGVLSCVIFVLFMVLRFVDPSFWIYDWLWVHLCIKTLSLSWFLVMVLFGSKAPILFVMIRRRGLLKRKTDYVGGWLIHLFEMWRFTQHICLLSSFAPVCRFAG